MKDFQMFASRTTLTHIPKFTACIPFFQTLLILQFLIHDLIFVQINIQLLSIYVNP